ncbi:hypothetical protein I79_018670 [Cricetulus griseus]|uniref:Uncharacterized protein n=1 Tax=Cricetulus griseus TaxID=10029 RepID=G3I5C6_CRIGR|nr:hypothetical protein I79_018670 [Cricetulus griseus]
MVAGRGLVLERLVKSLTRPGSPSFLETCTHRRHLENTIISPESSHPPSSKEVKRPQLPALEMPEVEQGTWKEPDSSPQCLTAANRDTQPCSPLEHWCSFIFTE